MKAISLLLLVAISMMTHAAELAGETRFAGKMILDNSMSMQQVLSQLTNTKTGTIVKSRYEVELFSRPAQRSAYHATPVDFEIFDAWVSLSGDLDDDGFFHNVSITFDADVNTETETVYAKVYLSHEGGDWYQVAQSDLFEIHADSAEDSYQIVTELVDGYEPGYYEVLIELHSLYHPGIVANRMLSTDVFGYGISLEDQQYDERYREAYYYETEVYGSGSISWIGLLMLAGLVWIKWRYQSSLRSPKIRTAVQPVQRFQSITTKNRYR